MNIVTDASGDRAVSQIEDRWGLPTPRRRDRDELFGPYHTAAGDGYLYYDAAGQRLTYADIRRPKSPDGPGTVGDSDRVTINRHLAELRELAPTIKPSDRSRQTTGAPFTFERYPYVWIFFPELQRWELAPLNVD